VAGEAWPPRTYERGESNGGCVAARIRCFHSVQVMG
jgi:hypothetical protein